MNQGDFDWRMEPTGISVKKWIDNKVVYFISNMHNPLQEQYSNRRQKVKTLPVGGTKVSKDYNKTMGYVEKADMLRALYLCDRKCKKRWHRMFFHFLSVIIVNSFVIYVVYMMVK